MVERPMVFICDCSRTACLLLCHEGDVDPFSCVPKRGDVDMVVGIGPIAWVADGGGGQTRPSLNTAAPLRAGLAPRTNRAAPCGCLWDCGPLLLVRVACMHAAPCSLGRLIHR